MTSTNLNPSAKNTGSAKKFGLKQAGATSLIGSLAFGMLAFAGISPAAAAERTVELYTAGDFAVLAGSTVTNTGPTVLNQNLGVHPGTAVTGFPPGLVNGTIHAADYPALSGKTDLLNAYNDAAGRPATAQVTDELAGLTLVGGVYESANGPLQLDGVLTLDGANDPSSVFILQSDSTLITGAASRINLINGAQACNIFWQVGSSATLGAGSSFAGSILALTSITAETGAVIEGRALARNGAVTLDTNVFTTPVCATVPVPTATATATATASPTATIPVVPPTDGTPTDGTPVSGTPTNGTPVVGTPTDGTPTETVPGMTTTDDVTTGIDTPSDSTTTDELPPTGANSMTPWFAGGGALLLLTGLGFLFFNRLRLGGTH